MQLSNKLARRGGPWQATLAAGAFLGACAWVAHAMRRKAEIRNPPRGRFIQVEGVDLHFTEHGNPQAPPLVLLHGVGSMGLEMELSGLVERAAQAYRVIVFDRPGYGHSTRPSGKRYTPQAQASLFVSALRLLGVENPVVLGHSWGSLVAHAMAQDHPDDIAAVVLASGYHTPSVRLDTLWLSAPAVPVLGTLMRYTISPILGRLMWPLMRWRIFAPAVTNPAFASRYPVWMMLRPLPMLASARETAMLVFQAMRLRAKEDTVQVPMVLVAGDKDRLMMTTWQSGRMHERRPGIPLHLAPGAGHMVHHSAPEIVMQAIDEAHQMARSQAVRLGGNPAQARPGLNAAVPPQGRHEGASSPQARAA